MSVRKLLFGMFIIIFAISVIAQSGSAVFDLDEFNLKSPIKWNLYNWSYNNGTTSSTATVSGTDPFITGASCKANKAGCYAGDGNIDRDTYFDFTGNQPVLDILKNQANYTICSWIFSNNDGTVDSLFRSDTGSMGIKIYRYTDNSLYVDLEDGTTEWTLNPTPNNAAWQHFCLIFNVTAQTSQVILGTSAPGDDYNGINTGTPHATVTNPAGLYIGDDANEGNQWNGRINGLVLYNGTMNWDEITQHFNDVVINDSGTPAPTPSVLYKTFTITAKDFYDDTSLNNLSVKIYNSTDSTTVTTMNGTFLFLNNTAIKFGGLYSLNFSSNDSGGYFSRVIPNINISDTLSKEGELYQSILTVTGYDGVSNDSITNLGFRVGTNSTTGNTATIWLKAGTHTLVTNKNEYMNNSKGFSISALETKNINMYLWNGQIKVNATNFLDGTLISNFTIILNDLNRSYTQTKSSTTGEIIFNVSDDTYNLSFTSFTNVDDNQTVIYGWESNRFHNITFVTYTTNSINISIYDEILGRTNFFEGKRVNFEFVSNVISYNFSTNSSDLYVDLLVPSEYKISYWTDNYKKRDYYFTLTNSTHNELELYLLSLGNDTDVEFTVNDNSNLEIEDALIQLKRYYVGTNSYRTVAMAKTNVEGKAIINVDYDDAFYIIQASSGDSITTSSGAKIFTTTITVVVDTSISPYALIDKESNIYSTLTFNNNTNTFTFSAQDLGGLSRLFTLSVYQDTITGSTLLCSNSETSSNVNILCQVNETATDGSYRAVGTVKGSNIVLKLYSMTKGAGKEVFRNSGVFWTIVFAGTLGGLGALAGPVPAILMFLSGLWVMYLLQLVVFTIGGVGVLFGITVIGGIIAYKMRK